MSLTVISLPEACMHAGNEMSCVIETSLPPSTVNLEIMVGINLETIYGSGVFDILVRRTLKPDLNGQCRFFLNRYLWDAFENAIDIPVVGGSSEAQLQHNVRKYSLFAIEYSGDPQAVTHLLATGTIAQERYAVKGAIAEARFAFRKFFGASGWNLLPTASGGQNRAFLDHRGLNPTTRTDEDQWLYYIWQDPLGTMGTLALDYKVKWYRSDGTTGESVFLSTAAQTLYEVYAYPAGFDQLGLDVNETATDKITRYETWIETSAFGPTVALSETKNWKVDRNYYEFAFQLQFENSYGVMEQITLRGAKTAVFDIEKQRVDSYRDNSYAATTGESVVYDVLVQNGHAAINGAGTANEARQFAMLKASRTVLLLTGSHGQSNIPVKVKGGKHEIDELTNTYTYEIELMHDFEDSVPDLI